MTEMYSYVVVYSTSHALQIEKRLADAGITCKLVPVPRNLSSDCGVCVRVARSDEKAARQVVAESGIEVQGVFQ